MNKAESGYVPNDKYHNEQGYYQAFRNVCAKEIGVKPEELGELVEVVKDASGNVLGERVLYPVLPERQDIGHP